MPASVLASIRSAAYLILASRMKSVNFASAGQSGELRELLLRQIWAGKIEGCGEIALEAATSRRRYYERALGALVLGSIGTSQQRRKLAKHLIHYAKSYPKRAIAQVIKAVNPLAISSSELEGVIRKHPQDNMEAIHVGLMYGLESKRVGRITQRLLLLD